jgi:hypothetical protein
MLTGKISAQKQKGGAQFRRDIAAKALR